MMRTLLLGVLALTSCDAGTSPRTSRTQPKQAKDPAPKPRPKKTARPTPHKRVPDGPGPLPSSDDPRARRSAVLSLLGGGPTAASLPVRATDPDRAFDPRLARAMTPTAASRVPRLRQGDYAVDGDLPPEVVRRIVRAHTNELRRCYTQQLARKPGVEGTLETRFTIDANGAVSTPEASGDGLDVTTTKCVKKSVKRWRFPKPEDGDPVKVTYAFELSPS